MSSTTPQTQSQYNRSFSGSVGSGMQSLVGSNKRRYYILEHKVSSKYHRAGESQKIIIDQIELGRNTNCQVRFDESFATVSRRHAAIVRDGDNWKLIQISKTNTTYLNGVKVENEWYLQNGDEIQLSTNGPKLGFIVPSGNNGLVKSIGLTQRMSLFRQQALRPYRKAIGGITAALVVCCVAGGLIIGNQGKVIKNQGEQIADSQKLIEQQENTIKGLGDENKQHELAIAAARQQSDSIASAAKNEIASLKRKIRAQGTGGNVPSIIEPFKDDIYFIIGAIYYNGEVLQVPLLNGEGNLVDEHGKTVNSPDQAAWMPCVWSGTAFLMDDGRMVTARHCVMPWRFDMFVAQMLVPDSQLEAVIAAYSRDGSVIEFSSKECVMDLSSDRVVGSMDNGQNILGCTPGRENDWAYFQTNQRGKLKAADGKSIVYTKAGEQLYVMGYPASLGADSPNQINPIYASASKGRDGLDSNGMILISGGVQGGNSGGPVFAQIDGEMKVVGIISTMIHGGNYGCATPISRIR